METSTSPPPVFDWSFGRLFRRKDLDETEDDPSEDEFALLVLNQPLNHRERLRKLWRNACLRVAADGGANQLCDIMAANPDFFGGEVERLDAIVGDLDSIRPGVERWYRSLDNPPKIERVPSQEHTDFWKAMSFVRESRPGTDIVVMGGLGGRVDQAMSQLHHLYLAQPGDGYKHGRVVLISEDSLTVLLKPGKHRISVQDHDSTRRLFGKYVGIIPVGEPCIISTRGLEWDVTDWSTSFGGRVSTSNHLLPETESVTVRTDKDVIFTIALRP